MTTEERVARLERSARRWKLAAVVALVVAGALGAARSNHVECKSLDMIDDHDRVRISLGMVKDEPVILLYGPDEARTELALTALTVGDNLGGIVMTRDRDGKPTSRMPKLPAK